MSTSRSPSGDDSFAERIRQLAQVQTPAELEERFSRFLLSLERQGGQQLFTHWYDVVIPVLAEVLREDADQVEVIDVSQDPHDVHIGVWNLMGGLAIQLRQFALARDLFVALLRELRALQSERGRVHKGTPYHQIGVTFLAAGEIMRARQYFEFAAVEDLILAEGSVDRLDSPASQTLRIQYGFERKDFEALAQRVRELSSDRTAVGHLKLENPELLFLEPQHTAEIASAASRE